MINNLKTIEDDDDSIYGFQSYYSPKRFSKSLKCQERDRSVYVFPRSITKIHRWNEKWSYEKEIECEERCQRLFQS